MCRATKYWLIYVASITCVVALVAVVAGSAFQGWIAVMPLALCFLIGVIIQRIYWSDFFRGRTLVASGRWEESLGHSSRFLARVRAHPRLKRLIWLTGTIHTPDIEASTLNNIGVARIYLGQFDLAAEAFGAARDLDPQYSHPYFNLAILAVLRANDKEARELADRSRRLGFSDATFDRATSVATQIVGVVLGTGYCRQCGYDLTGNVSGRCPECGTRIGEEYP